MDSETDEEILRATGRALCAHGFADLTIKHIAEESSLTTAAIHYHFDTKEALLTAFLDRSIDRIERQLAAETADPRRRLAQFLDVLFTPPETDDGEFAVALMELKAQAPYQDGFRDHFERFDQRMRQEVRAAVNEGIEAGEFATVDPATVARSVVTMANGGHVRGVALGEEPAETRAVVAAYLAQSLGWAPEVDA
ncbi:transcriptional regulator, TetR family [Halorhabdus utahensis DSM 12940]|uniref:Transcriptional regulator, TetR family n=1 Tax=Halorhabdus utahensis (strain DSM 12940 / JCM 11049 / AX-2) TaxID=519442 RepID=C7NTU4_HALUD|nr:TetR/AcrR family transcriptional regulator [Halorhabdus utahensis]ACV10933.1 transcriptional regulator, TetR family [Halorhabdus utahensis DSM 12940]